MTDQDESPPANKADYMLTVSETARMSARHPRYIRSLIERGYLQAEREHGETGDWRILPTEAARVLTTRPRGRGRGPKPRRTLASA